MDDSHSKNKDLEERQGYYLSVLSPFQHFLYRSDE